MRQQSSENPGTRRQVLELIAASGPVSAADLSQRLGLTSTGVRRHLGRLEQQGQVTVHPNQAPAGRGRPARRYIVTQSGQAMLAHRYADMAIEALHFLQRVGGDDAVNHFAQVRADDLRQRLVNSTSGTDDVVHRTNAVARALDADGYAATVRPVPGLPAVQLCQGHCPVQDVAEHYPQLCEAETEALSQALGVRVQRLSTLATGGHVCTTNIFTTPLPVVSRDKDGLL